MALKKPTDLSIGWTVTKTGRPLGGGRALRGFCLLIYHDTMRLYTRFKKELEDAIQSNDPALFEEVLSCCVDIGYLERKLDVSTAEHNERVRGMEYKVVERKETLGLLTGKVLTLGDKLTLRSDKEGKIEEGKITEVTAIDGNVIFLGEVGSKLFEQHIVSLPNTIKIKRLSNGNYITYGQYHHF